MDNEEGILGNFMIKLFGKSWRTTVSGLAVLVSQAIALIPGIPPDVAHAATVVGGILAGTGLLSAKDSKVSGLDK